MPSVNPSIDPINQLITSAQKKRLIERFSENNCLNDLECPITSSVMIDPIFLTCCHNTCDRYSIENTSLKKCPICRTSFDFDLLDLKPNLVVRRIIDPFLLKETKQARDDNDAQIRKEKVWRQFQKKHVLFD